MRSPGVRMVGRSAELGSVLPLLAGRDRSGAHFLAVSGEPGIGKTHLLAELCESAGRGGRLVLEGRAAEFEREEPFGLLVDALDDYLGSLQPRLLEQLGPERLGELARVLPAVAELGEPRAGLDAERYRLYRATRALLELLATRAPVVLALDDVQWADAASLELLSYLLRRPPGAAVLVALSFRPAQLDPRFSSQLAAAARGAGVTPLRLGPLSREETGELLAAEGVAADRLEPLHRLSGGNPFYAQQLARAGDGEAFADRAPDADGGVPSAVLATIDRERGALSAAGRLLLDGAAVAGDPFDFDAASTAAGLDRTEAPRRLDELLESELVRPTNAPTRFRFRHPIVRRAVYESVGRGWRMTAHERLVEALRGRGASSAELVRHVEASARTGDEGAIALLAEAGRAAVPRAPAIAARRFEAALRLLPEQGAAPRRLELLIPLATSLGAAGELERSREALLEAIALLPPGHEAERVRLVAFCGAAEHLLGRHAEAHERLVGALRELREGSPEGAALMVELAADALQMSDYEDAVRWALRARGIARELGEPVLRAAATAVAGAAQWGRSRAAEARGLVDESDALAERLDDGALAGRLDVLYYLALAELFTGDFRACHRHSERGLRLSRETGQGYVLVQLMVARAMALVGLGSVREAGEATAALAEAAQVSGTDAALLWASWAAAWVARATDLREAVRIGEESYALAIEHGSPAQAGGAGWVLGAALVEAGDGARARQVVLESCGGDDLPHILPSLRCLAYEVLTRSALVLGRPGEAAGWAARAGAAAAPLGLGVCSAQAGRAVAAVRLAEGAHDAAAREALAAAGAAERQDAPIEAARARILAGRALAAAGDRERALAVLEAARAELEAAGAVVWSDQAARELRRLGVRVARRGREGARVGVASLSGRELEVAELVADGRTNKEAAAVLFLSEKTVEKHLARVFEKLGVSRRAAVASRLADQRAADPGAAAERK